MTKSANKTDIVLSGRVFVDKILAYEHRDFALGHRAIISGDIKLIAVPKRGSDPCSTYVGFISATIWDGNAWRKLALRDQAATPATYHSQTERSRCAHDAIKHLRSLHGRVAHFLSPAYEVQPAAQVPSPVETLTASATGTDGAIGASAPETAAPKQAKPVQGELFSWSDK